EIQFPEPLRILNMLRRNSEACNADIPVGAPAPAIRNADIPVGAPAPAIRNADIPVGAPAPAIRNAGIPVGAVRTPFNQRSNPTSVAGLGTDIAADRNGGVTFCPLHSCALHSIFNFHIFSLSHFRFGPLSKCWPL